MKSDSKKIRADWYLILTILMAILFATVIVVTVSAISARDTNAEVKPAEVPESIPEVIMPEVEENIPDNIPDETPEPVPEAPDAPVTEETVTVIDKDELEMLACVIYQEAGGDGSCDECRRRVADVVLNRVSDERFPNTVYKVLTAKRQYGRFYWTGIVWPSRANSESEAYAVARAYRIAEEVLSGQHSALYGQGYIWQAEFVQGKDGFWCCGHYFGR